MEPGADGSHSRSAASAVALLGARAMKAKLEVGDEDLREDISTTSLVGGGFIAGDSLAALGIGIVSLMASMT